MQSTTFYGKEKTERWFPQSGRYSVSQSKSFIAWHSGHSRSGSMVGNLDGRLTSWAQEMQYGRQLALRRLFTFRRSRKAARAYSLPRVVARADTFASITRHLLGAYGTTPARNHKNGSFGRKDPFLGRSGRLRGECAKRKDRSHAGLRSRMGQEPSDSENREVSPQLRLFVPCFQERSRRS